MYSFVFAKCSRSELGIYKTHYKYDKARSLKLLEYFVYILVFRCLFCLEKKQATGILVP